MSNRIIAQKINGQNVGFVLPNSENFFWKSFPLDYLETPDMLKTLENYLLLNDDERPDENFFIPPDEDFFEQMEDDKIYLIEQTITFDKKGGGRMVCESNVVASFYNSETAVIEAIAYNERRPEPNVVFFLYPFNSPTEK